MSLKERLLSDMKVAMKEKDILRKNTIQLVRGAILQREKDTKEELSEDEVLEIIIQELKKRRDAMADFEKGNRPDLVADMQGEIDVLNSYLPKQLSQEELQAIIDEVIKEMNAVSMKDMGKVMSILVPRIKGKADNGLVSRMIKERLS